jgi:hypothetical protein
MSKKLLLEKYIKVAVKKALQEQEAQQRRAEKAMYLVYRFPGLKKVMEDLMSPIFGRYVNNIGIVSPKPTTFKVELINGQNFIISYLGRGNFSVKVAGKKYFSRNLGELERASHAITNLLELNYAPKEAAKSKETGGSKEPSPELGGGGGSEPAIGASPEDQALAADLAAAETGAEEATPPEEETPPAED